MYVCMYLYICNQYCLISNFKIFQRHWCKKQRSLLYFLLFISNQYGCCFLPNNPRIRMCTGIKSWFYTPTFFRNVLFSSEKVNCLGKTPRVYTIDAYDTNVRELDPCVEKFFVSAAEKANWKPFFVYAK